MLGLVLEVLSATAVPVGGTVEVHLEITNNSSVVAEDLQVTTRRGDAPGDNYPYYGTRAFPDDLAPGESTEVHLSVPTALGQDGTLAIEEPGAYPLMFALTGTQAGEAAALADDAILLNVGESETRNALNVIYPLTADLDIVPGETGGEPLILQSEHLAGELAPGGRLSELLDTYLSHDLKGAGCVALDPALLDTVDRMAEGYTVSDTRPSVVTKRQRLRDSWRNHDTTPGTAGTGSVHAREWLDKVAQLDCTMALPWGNTDVDAVARTHNTWLLHEAIRRGPSVVKAYSREPLPFIIPPTGHVPEDLGAPALVADDAGWVGQAVTYNSWLKKTLEEDDSPATAEAALRYALDQGDTVALLPTTLSPQQADAILGEAETLRRTAGIGKLEPKPGDGTVTPGPVSDKDVLVVQQQARYTDELTKILVDDPAIDMTSYGFTLPLRRDLLLGVNEPARLKVNSATLQELRAAVSLIPPGNVYTRTSDSSPLLIVAENGLPLPVDAQILYEGDADLTTPTSLRIPAKGSITVTMTAKQQGRNDIRLWLATPKGDTISQPVVITVQTRSGKFSLYGLGAAVALIGAWALRRKIRKV